jgi:hypothetical protein
MKQPLATTLTRWLLATWEGLCFGWFLFVIYIAAINLSQAAEFMWHPLPDERLPRLTVWLRTALPDELWSLLTGWASASIGFGLISFSSDEALSSRVFRWVSIATLTTFVAFAIPMMERFKNLSGGPDLVVWDDALFASLGLSLLIGGIVRQARKQVA